MVAIVCSELAQARQLTGERPHPRRSIALFGNSSCWRRRWCCCCCCFFEGRRACARAATDEGCRKGRRNGALPDKSSSWADITANL